MDQTPNSPIYLEMMPVPNLYEVRSDLSINMTPIKMSSAVAPLLQSPEQLVNKAALPTSDSLVSSKGPTKRKPFEDNPELVRAISYGLTKDERMDIDNLEKFADMFKKERLKLGFTQGDVGTALGKRHGTDISQTTISRFEALNLSFKKMSKLRPLLEGWLADAEAGNGNVPPPNPLVDYPTDETTVKADVSVTDVDTGDEPAVRRRKKRTNIEVAQKTALDSYFAMNDRPDPQRLKEIANLLELDRDVVRVWFCNRRQKLKKADEPEPVEDPLLSSLRAIAEGQT